MKKKNIIKYIIIGVIILVVFVLLIMLLSGGDKRKELDLNETSSNYVVDDSEIMNLYNRFNPERELMFNLVGSDTNEDYYGFYYRNDKTTYEEFDNNLKNTILINDADYKTLEYDSSRRCYYMSLSDYEVIYDKLFGSDDYDINFDESFKPRVYVDSDSICITDRDINNGYDKIVDTYMVNAINDGEYITIYERVAFIKIDKNYLYFYSDYDMNNLVYKLDNKDILDKSFINDSSIVSNVLIEYQKEFVLYEYTYIKGTDTYYLESIER